MPKLQIQQPLTILVWFSHIEICTFLFMVRHTLFGSLFMFPRNISRMLWMKKPNLFIFSQFWYFIINQKIFTQHWQLEFLENLWCRIPDFPMGGKLLRDGHKPIGIQIIFESFHQRLTTFVIAPLSLCTPKIYDVVA